MEYITFPWEQLGRMLRSCSLSGAPGDMAAWTAFLCISALPLAAALYLKRRRLDCRADVLLLPLSAAVCAGLWFFTNPSYMDRYLSPFPTGGLARYALAATIDSLFLTWLLLRYMLRSGKMDRHELLSHLQILLLVYGVLSAGCLLWQEGRAFLEECASMREGNSGAGSLLSTVTILFLAFRALLGLLPGLSKLALLLLTGSFLRSYGRDPFGSRSHVRMERLRQASGKFLAAILLSTVGANALQLLFSRFLLNSFHRILLPLPEILLVLGIRMVSFLYLEGKRLKEDNDMFI